MKKTLNIKLPKRVKLALAAISLATLISAYIYPYLPNEMIIHWNNHGTPDSMIAKNIGTFLLPILTLILYVLLYNIPKIDPLYQDQKKFKRAYGEFMLVFVLFMLYIHLLVLFANINFKFNLVQFVTPGLSVLIYNLAHLLTLSSKNWFIGIRTPWTLSSSIVWKYTHRMTAKLFKIASFIILGSSLIPEHTVAITVSLILSIILFSIGWSYYLYQQEKTERFG